MPIDFFQTSADRVLDHCLKCTDKVDPFNVLSDETWFIAMLMWPKSFSFMLPWFENFR